MGVSQRSGPWQFVQAIPAKTVRVRKTEGTLRRCRAAVPCAASCGVRRDLVTARSHIAARPAHRTGRCDRSPPLDQPRACINGLLVHPWFEQPTPQSSWNADGLLLHAEVRIGDTVNTRTEGGDERRRFRLTPTSIISLGRCRDLPARCCRGSGLCTRVLVRRAAITNTAVPRMRVRDMVTRNAIGATRASTTRRTSCGSGHPQSGTSWWQCVHNQTQVAYG